ncbi:MAG: conjugal transfer protein TraF [Candidatus Eisenbacteria bacterium]
MKRTVCVAILALAFAGPAWSYFDRLEVGSRALAMGKAFHAIADDPSAVYWNPAGFGWQRRNQALFAHYRPYVVEDLSVNFAALTLPVPKRIGTLGLGWHHTGLADVVSEDLFFFSLGRRSSLPAVGDVGVGVTGKIFRVGYQNFTDLETLEEVDYGSQTKFAVDVGAIVQPTDLIRVGLIVRNIGEPEFDFVSGNGGTRMEAEAEGSVSYRWNEASLVSAGFARDRRGDYRPMAGGEVTFFDVFALRSGVFDYEFWGGFGILTGSWFFDAGFNTHKDLGVSYMASVTVPFGRER